MIVRNPAKTTSVPLNIWKVDAYLLIAAPEAPAIGDQLTTGGSAQVGMLQKEPANAIHGLGVEGVTHSGKLHREAERIDAGRKGAEESDTGWNEWGTDTSTESSDAGTCSPSEVVEAAEKH